jgi:hypothetical protein
VNIDIAYRCVHAPAWMHLLDVLICGEKIPDNCSVHFVQNFMCQLLN